MLYYVMYLMKYQSNIYYSKVIWEIVVLEIIIRESEYRFLAFILWCYVRKSFFLKSSSLIFYWIRNKYFNK